MSILKNKAVRCVAILLLVAALIPLVLEGGTLYAERIFKPWRADYEKQELMPTLKKDTLTEADYELIYKQTGLTRVGTDALLESGRIEKFFMIQDALFTADKYRYDVFDPYTGIFKKHYGSYPVTELQDGDIIYTPGSYFSFIQLGHCCMVVDAKAGIVCELQGYGDDFIFSSVRDFCESPAFAVIRVKADEATRAEAARYLACELSGVEYGILGGAIPQKNPKTLTRSQCAHILWYAYMHVGIDIDGTGGIPMTPRDIFISENVEIIQVFGIDLDSVPNR